MKNGWAFFFRGYVLIQMTNGDQPYFLNECARHHVRIWRIKQVDEQTIQCYIDLQDAKRIRHLLYGKRGKIEYLERSGFPFFLRKMLRRSGFPLGIFAFFLVLLLMSNVIWKIDVVGGSAKIEHELRQVLQEQGIKVGTFQFQLPPLELIQQTVMDEMDDVTWIGIRQKGTTFEFEIVEQQLAEEKEKTGPRHLIATKDAIIHHLFVEQGEAAVKRREFVKKGDLLVSGLIGREGNEEIVSAKATVFGEIWYKSNISISTDRLFSTLTGNSKTKHFLTIRDFSLPIWGFRQHQFSQAERIEISKPFHLLRWTFPIRYKRVIEYEMEQIQHNYTQEEAMVAAKKQARTDLIKRLPNNAKVIGEKVLHEAFENGKVNLQIHYKVIEEITSELPIIQGE